MWFARLRIVRATERRSRCKRCITRLSFASTAACVTRLHRAPLHRNRARRSRRLILVVVNRDGIPIEQLKRRLELAREALSVSHYVARQASTGPRDHWWLADGSVGPKVGAHNSRVIENGRLAATPSQS